MACTSDGASANTRLIRLHNRNRNLKHKTLNPCVSSETDNREFFFIPDPPHLIKTVWNCWASKARNLWVNTRLHVHVNLGD